MPEPQATLNLLCFDFGSQRIGVAFGSQAHIQPTELPPLPARDGIPHWQQLDQLVDHWQTQAFVVGMPYHMDGSISLMAQRARKFANRLVNRYQCPCYVIDERLSSYEAKQERLHNQGSHNWKKHSVDSIAARLILQSWYQESEHKLAQQPL
jgi:putative holliday junction resolvase